MNFKNNLFTNPNSNATSSRKSCTPGRSNIVKPSPRDENMNMNPFLEKAVVSGNKPSQREKLNRQPLEEIPIEQESKKMKVQSILDKLKIKINKN